MKNKLETKLDDATSHDELTKLIQRIERLEEEKSAIAQDIRDVYLEAKSNGFDPKAMRQVVARRKKEREDVELEDATIDIYEKAIGEAR